MFKEKENLKRKTKPTKKKKVHRKKSQYSLFLNKQKLQKNISTVL